MKIAEFSSILQGLGLSPSESKVYLSSLSLGPSTVMKIAAAAEIKRTTVYTILEKLKSRGFMSVQVKGLKKLYSAEDPERLERMIDLQKEEFRKILPELKAVQNLTIEGSFIKYYSGIEGVKRVYDSILEDLKPGDEYLIISDMEKFLAMDKEYFERFIERRAKLNLKVRSLFQKSAAAEHYKKIERNTNQSIKFLPDNTKLTVNLVITPYKVIITQITNPIMCIVIENKNIVNMHKEQFDINWEALK